MPLHRYTCSPAVLCSFLSRHLVYLPKPFHFLLSASTTVLSAPLSPSTNASLDEIGDGEMLHTPESHTGPLETLEITAQVIISAHGSSGANSISDSLYEGLDLKYGPLLNISCKLFCNFFLCGCQLLLSLFGIVPDFHILYLLEIHDNIR